MAREFGRAGGLVGVLVVAGVVFVASGCGADLGPCDMAAATVVVYRGGIPYYEGQALVETHCAGSFCHGANAKGADRLGAPAGLNFDLTVVTPMVELSGIARLRAGWGNVRDWAETMFEQVDAGSMPPGKAGRREPVSWYHAGADGHVPTEGPSELFDVRSAQGKKTLRNWLACGAPVVSGTTDLDAIVKQEVDRLGGDVLPPTGTPECVPTWSSLYAQIVENPQTDCTGCHSAGSFNFAMHLLDLSRDDGGGVTEAHAAVVDREARGTQCGGMGKLVDPMNCDGSLLYRKIATVPAAAMNPLGDPGSPPMPDTLCGDLMPPGRMFAFPTSLLDCLCEWIDMGAPMN